MSEYYIGQTFEGIYPPEAAFWCNENGAWIEKQESGYVIVGPSLDELKEAKINLLKQIRDRLEAEPIEYNGNRFDFDSKARDRINAAMVALELGGDSLQWTTADNTETTVTVDDLKAIIAAVAMRGNDLHVKYRELKSQVEAATSKAEIEAITWEV